MATYPEDDPQIAEETEEFHCESCGGTEPAFPACPYCAACFADYLQSLPAACDD